MFHLQRSLRTRSSRSLWFPCWNVVCTRTETKSVVGQLRVALVHLSAVCRVRHVYEHCDESVGSVSVRVKVEVWVPTATASEVVVVRVVCLSGPVPQNLQTKLWISPVRALSRSVTVLRAVSCELQAVRP